MRIRYRSNRALIYESYPCARTIKTHFGYERVYLPYVQYLVRFRKLRGSPEFRSAGLYVACSPEPMNEKCDRCILPLGNTYEDNGFVWDHL